MDSCHANDFFAMDNTQAIVVKHTGSHYLLTVLPQWNLFPAVLRGRIRQKGSTSTNPVAVGDKVDFSLPEGRNLTDMLPDTENPAVIDGVIPRRNYVIRRSANLSRQSHIIAANIDMAFNFGTDIEGILDAIYFVLITMTTVGYGDIYPHTSLARIIVGLECLTSYILLGIMIGIISRGVKFPQVKD